MSTSTRATAPSMIWSGFAGVADVAVMQTLWHRSGVRGVAAADALLRHAAVDQRRGRRRHRARAGVRVRHELVGVLALRRRRVRRAAGDGRAGRVLPGVDVPRPVGVRLGPAVAARAPVLHLDGRARLVAVGGVHHGRELVDAAPGRLRARRRPASRRGWTTSARVFTNPVFLWGYFHVLLAALATGTLVLLAVSAWHLRRAVEVDAFRQSAGAGDQRARAAEHRAGAGRQPARRDRDALSADEDRGRRGAVGHLPAVLVLRVPDRRRQERRGPAEGDRDPAPAVDPGHAVRGTGRSSGSTSCRRSTSSSTGPGDYIPNVFVQYWSMRVMAYLATAIVLLSLWGAWLLLPAPAGDVEVVPARRPIWAVFTPFIMNTAGWMLTENGRQPWIVQGLMKTADGVSPSVSATEIWISLAVFALLYLALGVTELVLMLRYARRGLPDEAEAARNRPGPDLLTCRSRPSGSSSSPSSGRGSSSWRASTSASACCTPIVGRDERERRTALKRDRAVLGRQRGLADRRRRGDVRGVPRLVRDAVLRPVPGAAADPGGADRARGRRSSSARRSRRRAGGGRGRGRRRWAAARSRCCSGSGSAAWSPGCRSTPTASTRGGFVDIFTAYGVWTGLTLLSLSVLHGATFLALKTEGPVRERSRALGVRALRWPRSSPRSASPCGRRRC